MWGLPWEAEPTAGSCLFVCRWSVMAYETKLPRQASSSAAGTGTEDLSEGSEVCISSLLFPSPVLSCPTLV